MNDILIQDQETKRVLLSISSENIKKKVNKNGVDVYLVDYPGHMKEARSRFDRNKVKMKSGVAEGKR
jgi:hypothetical protein